MQADEQPEVDHSEERDLNGMKVAILLSDNFEQIEMTGPRQALQQAGASTRIVSSKAGRVQGMQHDRRADQFEVDLTFDQANPEDFDAALLPGGVMNGDQLRMLPQAQAFVKSLAAAGKPIAAICHAPWLLVSARLVSGKTLTSWPTLQDDIRNAGGKWVDRDVVVDGKLVTSRKPDDIPAFNREMIGVFSERLEASGTH
jgi:protease I